MKYNPSMDLKNCFWQLRWAPILGGILFLVLGIALAVYIFIFQININLTINYFIFKLGLPDILWDQFAVIIKRSVFAIYFYGLLLVLWGAIYVIFWFCVSTLFLFGVDVILGIVGWRGLRRTAFYQKHSSEYRKRLGILVVFLTAMALVLVAAFAMITDFKFDAVKNWAFIVIIGCIIIISIQYCIFYFKRLRGKHPKIIRIIYGKRASLGTFIFIGAGFLLLIFYMRVGIPLLGFSLDMISEKLLSPLFHNLALCIVNSEAALEIKNYLSSTNAVNSANFTELLRRIEEGFSSFSPGVIKFISSLDKEAIRSSFHLLFWVFISVSISLLLIPMIFYNLLTSEEKGVRKLRSLKEVFTVTLVSLVGGFIFQWAVRWLFLFPLPKLEIASLTSLAIFTVYTALLAKR